MVLESKRVAEACRNGIAMDQMAYTTTDEPGRVRDLEFMALFAQLDHAEAVAPVEPGLQRLCHAMAIMQRPDPLKP